MLKMDLLGEKDFSRLKASPKEDFSLVIFRDAGQKWLNIESGSMFSTAFLIGEVMT